MIVGPRSDDITQGVTTRRDDERREKNAPFEDQGAARVAVALPAVVEEDRATFGPIS